MKSTGVVRNIDELGRIVIPKEIRDKMDMSEGTSVEIYVENGKVIISRYYTGCHFCGENSELSELKGKKVCKSCLKELANMVKDF